jgi:transposase
MDKESLRLLLAQGMSVEKIGERFGRHPSTVAYWMRKHGLDAPNRDKHAAKGGIERERLEGCVEAGMTIAEIADVVGLSKTSVRHWLRRYELKTRNKVGPRLGRATADGKDEGKLEIIYECLHHGPTAYVLEGRGYYRCKRCRSDGISRHRRRLKETLVAEAGGACVICGYDRSLAALEFHHLDPVEKRLGISANGLTLSLEAVRTEAAKCVLLCSNCHAEVENGYASLPVKSGPHRGLRE